MSVMWRNFPLTEVINNGRTEASARSAQVLRNGFIEPMSISPTL